MADRSRPALIFGTGIAGLYVALRAAQLGRRTVLVTKAKLEESNTRYAQGGIAAAIGSDDSPARHLQDTVAAGDGLVDRPAARLLAESAPQRISDLVRFGVPFDTADGVIALGREAAHSRDRILHAGGDATGLSIEQSLQRRVLEAGIDVRERTILQALLPRGEKGIEAVVSDPEGRRVERLDPTPVVLATGGAGGLYRESSNPSVTTGEGLAIAFRAGATLCDMEFVQFHPTVFYRTGAPRFLITEALRGEGAVLRNSRGERFMTRYHPKAELAPRDVVSRAIRWEMERTGRRNVELDATGLARDRLYGRFPSVCRFLAAYGVDPARDRIPVAPAAHFTIGGVRTDLEGRSTIRGLYAVGEVASTGVHGANRLGSNSLLEGLVFGERVASGLRRPSAGGPGTPRRLLRIPWPPGEGRGADAGEFAEIQDWLWTDVGIVRDGPGLSSAVERLEALARHVEPRDGRPAASIAHATLTAYLIARAALTRTESRGAHYRTDYPEPQALWKTHLGLLRDDRAG